MENMYRATVDFYASFLIYFLMAKRVKFVVKWLCYSTFCLIPFYGIFPYEYGIIRAGLLHCNRNIFLNKLRKKSE